MLLWVSVALITLAATLAVVWPLLSRRSSAAALREEDEARRLAVFRDRKREIERELEAGRLTPEEAQAAQADLVEQLAAALPQGGDAKAESRPGGARGATVTALAAVVLVPVIAFGVYGALGTPELASPEAARLGMPPDPQELEEIIAEFEKRSREQPDDGENWAFLAEARKFKGDHAAAIPAFEEAVRRLPPNARLLADFAESVALAQGGDFSGRPTELLEQALKVDPDDSKSVALMGAAQFRAGNLERARTYLKKLLDDLDPQSPEAQQIGTIVAQIDSQIAQRGGSAAPGAPAGQGSAAGRASAKAGASVSGTVAIDPSLAGSVPPGAVLFVVAREENGSRVPVAALRIASPQFPLEFSLDDSNAMDPQRPLSSAGSLAIEARLSASGGAARQPGDPYGTASGVKAGARDLRIVIDRRVQQ